MWQNSQSTTKPEVLEIGKSTVYLRKDIVKDGDVYKYKEKTMPYEEWEVLKGTFSPVTDDLRSDVDFALALLGADESLPELNANWDSRIEKYKAYYESGKWSLERINLLLERGLITQEEYNYIVGENK